MFLPIICFGFMLGLSQYENSLYAVTFFMGISYFIHKSTDTKKDDSLDTV